MISNKINQSELLNEIFAVPSQYVQTNRFSASKVTVCRPDCNGDCDSKISFDFQEW